MGSRCCVTNNQDIVSKDTIFILNEQNPSFYEFIESIEEMPSFLEPFLCPDFYLKLLKGIPFNSIFYNYGLNDEEYILGIKLLKKMTVKSMVFTNDMKLNPVRISEIFHIFKHVQSLIDEYMKIVQGKARKVKSVASKIFNIYLHVIFSFIKLSDLGHTWWEISNIDHFITLKNELLALFTQLQPSFLSISITHSKVSQYSPKSKNSKSSSMELSNEHIYSENVINEKKKSSRHSISKIIKPSLDSIEEEIIEKRRKESYLKFTSITKQMSLFKNSNSDAQDEFKSKNMENNFEEEDSLEKILERKNKVNDVE